MSFTVFRGGRARRCCDTHSHYARRAVTYRYLFLLILLLCSHSLSLSLSPSFLSLSLWNSSQAPLAGTQSDHHTLISCRCCRPQKGIEFYWNAALHGSVRVCAYLCVRYLCICYFYAWFIDFILWPLDWTLNEFLNCTRCAGRALSIFPLLLLLLRCVAAAVGAAVAATYPTTSDKTFRFYCGYETYLKWEENENENEKRATKC